VSSALLRELVIITGRLAGHSWLEANADTTAAFTALLTAPEPPPLAELDRILVLVLSKPVRPVRTEGMACRRSGLGTA
jgi:hypothetical protein